MSSVMRSEDECSYSQPGTSDRPSLYNTPLINYFGHRQPPQAISSAQQAHPPFSPFLPPQYLSHISYNAAFPATPESNRYYGDLLRAKLHQQAAPMYNFPVIVGTPWQPCHTLPAIMHPHAHPQLAMTSAQDQARLAMSRYIQPGVHNPPFTINVPPPPEQHQALGMCPMDCNHQRSQMVSPTSFDHALCTPIKHEHPQGLQDKQGNLHPHHRGSVVQRSILLNKFLSDKLTFTTWGIKDVVGHIVEFSMDHDGSKFLQTQLKFANQEERQLVYVEASTPIHTTRLIQDIFGNYVIQNLIEFGTLVQRAQLISVIEGNILTFSLHMYGCRVVQKAIDFITPKQQTAFVKELCGSILNLATDIHANHVLRKFIRAVPSERLSFVEAFKGLVHELAIDRFGCIVLQEYLASIPQEDTRTLVDEMLIHTRDLMSDPHGNFIVQYILEYGQPYQKRLIAIELQGNMLFLAQQKFASRVCEKALITSTAEMRSALIDEIVIPKCKDTDVITTMICDRYANYVLQRALSVSEGVQKEALQNKVENLRNIQLQRPNGCFQATDSVLEGDSVNENDDNGAQAIRIYR
ncbi:hypothetical protein QCA50_007076 [Cerrena zonata]|uniref:PUM-HD domain-containing protein n=1 Tax=Cerrena zonata TaxID=2478898 RepID=A0AAW0GDP8_9APHY